MSDQFDLLRSESSKREGMCAAADCREDLLAEARRIAKHLAYDNGGECHADMVGREMKRRGMDQLGPAAGSLFKTDEWVWTGRFVKSARVTNHARLLRVWRMR